MIMVASSVSNYFVPYLNCSKRTMMQEAQSYVVVFSCMV